MLWHLRYTAINVLFRMSSSGYGSVSPGVLCFTLLPNTMVVHFGRHHDAFPDLECNHDCSHMHVFQSLVTMKALPFCFVSFRSCCILT